MRSFRILQAVVMLVGAWLTADTAQSSTLNGSDVQATVVASCITSAAPVDFKPSSVASDAGQQNGVGAISITCKRGVPYHVHISYGGNGMRGAINLAARGTSTTQHMRIYADALPRRVAANSVSDVSRPRPGISEDSVVVSVTF
ncbi:MAG TPA: spore coat protein U domain-containing protein [Candidatus Acidoferrales bacterium]|nr:spore coat protein U domain-containing protein [Candidatus Acidoferrales bacterium]